MCTTSGIAQHPFLVLQPQNHETNHVWINEAILQNSGYWFIRARQGWIADNSFKGGK